MVVIGTNENLPDPNVLGKELSDLFNGLKQYYLDKARLSSENSESRLKKVQPYVIAFDPDFEGSVENGWFSKVEMVELRCVSKLFESQIYLLEKNEHWADALRLKLLHYLQIMEADYPATLVLNAFRFGNDEPPVWKFLELADNHKEKNGFRYPSGKLAKISALVAESHPTLSVHLSRLYQSSLRNSVAHSHFHIQQDGGMILLTSQYSSGSRSVSSEEIAGTACPSYTREAFNIIYKSVIRYWECAEAHYRWFENLEKCW